MVKVGVVMDPIASIKPHKDTSLAMLLESKRRGWQNYYIEPEAIWLRDGVVWGRMQPVDVVDDPNCWYELSEPIEQPLPELDVLLMRKDPPFNMDYIYITYLLEQAQAQGLLVVNDPQSLRDANEKLFTTWFPQCCPKTLISSDMRLLKEFAAEEDDVVIKPLHGMGGASIFRASSKDVNLPVIIETLTDYGKKLVMAQTFIPEIAQGDKRILMIDGKPVSYALARLPAAGDFRGNLAAGGQGRGQALSDRDRWICEQVGQTLRDKGLWFVGLDVIGDYLTEINVTSPTCVRELDKQFDLNICADLMDFIETKL